MQNKLLQLALISGVGIAMLTGRILITDSLGHFGLFWNLFLAWIPLLVAYLTRVLWQQKIISRVGIGIGVMLWLLFFPNAPYLITDLIHLKEVPDYLLWYDSLLSFSFALAGLLAGLYSALLIHRLIEKVGNQIWAWTIMVGSLIVSSYGVYLGRFGRWNSWDIITNPFSLVRYTANSLQNPVAIKLTVAFSFAMLIIYSAFWLYTYKPKEVKN